VWFSRFRVENFNFQDNPRPGLEKKFEDEDLQALINENPCQTQQELGKQVWFTPVAISNWLHAIGKIHKEGKWVPHLLTEENKNRGVNICLNLLSRYNEKNFLHKVITGDEKWIAYDSPKRRKSWLDPGQPSPFFPRPNIHVKKVLLWCVWWDWKGIIHYELLERGQTVTGERY